MYRIFTLVTAFCVTLGSLSAQHSPEVHNDPYETTFYKLPKKETVKQHQKTFFSSEAWNAFKQNHPTWHALVNTNAPQAHRLFGTPVALGTTDPLAMAEIVIQDHLSAFELDFNDLVLDGDRQTGKFVYANLHQTYEGMEVLESQLQIKATLNGDMIALSTDLYSNIEPANVLSLSTEAIEVAGSSYIPEALNVVVDAEPKILPVPQNGETVFTWVYSAKIYTLSNTGIPSRYLTLFDAETGAVLYCANEIHHHSENCRHTKKEGYSEKTPAETPSLFNTEFVSEIVVTNPYDGEDEASMGNMRVEAGGEVYFTDMDGDVFLEGNPTEVEITLSGPWSTIFTNNVTPGGTIDISGTPTEIEFGDEVGNIRERSAFYHVGLIHDHITSIFPDFDGMNFSLPTNIDVAGECNAFYDGASINFYNTGGGCNATSLVSDVVYHEYGHGINDNYYTDQGVNFSNGAMNEGYADFWAMSLLETSLLGVGFYDDTDDPLRRYDINPKVYPDNLIGQVHNDGEIICGAWYTTHELLGGDWQLSIDLFAETFNGLQANTFNGNEGQAYTDVLLDLLQADDDDNDLSNATPNATAILEGFAIHGITLISEAEIEHEPAMFAVEDEDVIIEAELDINADYIAFLNTVEMTYKVNGADWETVPMDTSDDEEYSYNLGELPMGTVVKYFFAATDIFGTSAGTNPVGVTDNDHTNLPHTLMIGVVRVLESDEDENFDFGTWELGVDDDDATTGEWESDFPVGSFGEPGDLSTAVAPYEQVTDDGEFCFITAQSADEADAIGANDVDGGKTTLRSESIDLSNLDDPILSYWRWYTNSPPSGANPGADWFQVQVSEDGGSSWEEIESTNVSDASWRRNAVKLSDYISVYDDVKFQFIASDSIRPGENLDGGSLVEAAVDDIIIWEPGMTESVDDLVDENVFVLSPNPSDGNQTFIQLSDKLQASFEVEIVDITGRVVSSRAYGLAEQTGQRVALDLRGLSNGTYLVKLQSEGVEWTQKLVLRK